MTNGITGLSGRVYVGMYTLKTLPLLRRTFDIDGSVVGFDDAFYDGQTQTGAGDVAGLIIFDAIEPGKHPLQVLRRDTPSGICHDDAEVSVLEG